MRVGKFLGKEVVMNNRDWERCLRRVDVGRVRKELEEYIIRVSCPFCRVDGRTCKRCPLDVFATVRSIDYGCLRLFKMVAGKLDVKYCLMLRDRCVVWWEREDEDARKILKFIHARLLKMKEV